MHLTGIDHAAVESHIQRSAHLPRMHLTGIDHAAVESHVHRPVRLPRMHLVAAEVVNAAAAALNPAPPPEIALRCPSDNFLSRGYEVT